MEKLEIGNRVVCENNDSCFRREGYYGTRDFLIEGQAYTVIGFDKYGNVILEDIIAGYYESDDSQVGYPVEKFRKLDYEFVDDVIQMLLDKPVDLN